MEKIEVIQTKIKFTCFGKTHAKKSKVVTKTDIKNLEEEEAKELMRKQSKRMETEISKIKSSNQSKTGKLFKMRDVVAGPRKGGQEAQAILDSQGELVVSTSEIKRVTLKHCHEVLRKNKPEDDFIELIKIKEDLHKRMMENNTSGDFVLTQEGYWHLVDKFRRKDKRSYDFLIKAGGKFQAAVFKLCARIINGEEVPSCFDKTLLIQLYKGKGNPQELGNSRFLHMKEWLPRLCEAAVVEAEKKTILANSSPFQLGGQPKKRPQFHLFTLKSLIGLKEKRKPRGTIITVVDIQKFFDKESLFDVMHSLQRVDIDQRSYRLWWKLNQRCLISVKTGAGLSEEEDAGPVLGQGSAGGALASQLNLDLGVGDYFNGSQDEEMYGVVRLQPLMWIDDLARGAADVSDTRAGNVKLHKVMQSMQLKIHPTKSNYIVFGSKD